MQPVSVQDADQDKVPAGTQRRRQSLFHPFADEKSGKACPITGAARTSAKSGSVGERTCSAICTGKNPLASSRSRISVPVLIPVCAKALNAPDFDHRSDGRCQYGKNILESGRQKRILPDRYPAKMKKIPYIINDSSVHIIFQRDGRFQQQNHGECNDSVAFASQFLHLHSSSVGGPV